MASQGNGDGKGERGFSEAPSEVGRGRTREKEVNQVEEEKGVSRNHQPPEPTWLEAMEAPTSGYTSPASRRLEVPIRVNPRTKAVTNAPPHWEAPGYGIKDLSSGATSAVS